MGKTWVSCRLSDNAMSIIKTVQERRIPSDRTDAIEFIIREYQRYYDKPLRKLFHLNADKVKPLEAFASAE